MTLPKWIKEWFLPALAILIAGWVIVVLMGMFD
jgi:hypothetical protein